MTEIVVKNSEAQRLDVYLAKETGYTRSYIKQLIDGGHILLNNAQVKAGKIISDNDKITIDQPQKESQVKPQNIPLDIIYQDEEIAVINKQAGLSVHPAGGAVENTLVNALMFHLKSLSGINGVVRPGIVHRLDKDTTGVMVIAKTDKAHLSLSKQIADRTVKKTYRAILEGVVKDDKGEINTGIARHNTDRKKMTVNSMGRQAITAFKVIKRFKENTYAELDIKTGRTHQIRVHCKHIGYPVVGDKTYGYKKQKFNLKGQLLHAYSLEFTHPATKKKVEFIAPLPHEFQRILEILEKE